MENQVFNLALRRGASYEAAQRLERQLRNDTSTVRESWLNRMDNDSWCGLLPDGVTAHLDPAVVARMIKGAEVHEYAVEAGRVAAQSWLDPDDLIVAERAVIAIAMYHGATRPTAEALFAELRDDWCDLRQLWVARVGDFDGWCRDVGRSRVCDYLDPRTVRRIVKGRQRSLDPFDPDTIRRKAFYESLRAGGKFTVTEIATGKVVAAFDVEGTRQGAASEN